MLNWNPADSYSANISRSETIDIEHCPLSASFANYRPEFHQNIFESYEIKTFRKTAYYAAHLLIDHSQINSHYFRPFSDPPPPDDPILTEKLVVIEKWMIPLSRPLPPAKKK